MARLPLTAEGYDELVKNEVDHEDFVQKPRPTFPTPGFGRLVNSPEMDVDGDFYGNQSEFDMGHQAWSAARATTREIAMIQLMNGITEKVDWEKKVFDDEIISKWRKEARTLPKLKWGYQEYEPISEEAFDFCITELRFKAQELEKHNFVAVLDVCGRILKSDRLVGEDLRQKLISACAPLQNVLESERDWHPGSDGQVLNLVHPSLYPLVYGRTRALWNSCTGLSNWQEYCGKGRVIPAPRVLRESSGQYSAKLWSTKFQWLPCEVKFSESPGNKPKIVTYINNLQPDKNAELYAVLEEFIDLSIPLWNDCLALKNDFDTPQRHRITCLEALWKRREESEVPAHQKHEWSDPDRTWYVQEIGPEDRELNIKLEDEMNRYEMDAHRWYEVPEPKQWKDYVADNADSGKPIDLRTKFKMQGLQVIVKLASIELTPANPEYPGGNWHLEGMMNERIVATSLFYYDSANVTDSSLSFRHTASMENLDFHYEQNDHGGLELIYGTGLSLAEPFQELGSVPTKQGRIIAFPNVLQHRVAPFRLADATKPGHRRLLVLWLVDPSVPVTSTANVPPQQLDWWPPEVHAREAELLAHAHKLPPELQTEIYRGTGPENWAITDQEARSFRLELMKERTRHHDTVKEIAMQELSYFFCEH